MSTNNSDETMAYDDSCNGIDVWHTTRGSVNEVFATALPVRNGDVGPLLKCVGDTMREFDADILRMHVFGSIDAYPAFRDAAVNELGALEWPLTYVEGNSCSGGTLAGVQVHAVSGTSVETVSLNDLPVGRVFEDGNARYCYLGDLCASESTLPRTEQGRESFEKMERALGVAGMGLHELVRTWLFIDGILDWYDDFNRMRDAFFRENGMFDRFLPASTGIGGGNPNGSAVAACALAVQPLNGELSVQEVLSPLQCPAHDYGSSFSRAAEITTPDYQCVLVSGTASIAPEGNTVHKGNTRAQVDLTLSVVQEILRSRGMTYVNAVRGNAYFKHDEDASEFVAACADFAIPAGRIVVSRDDVCRDDLLFEIELDAWEVRS